MQYSFKLFITSIVIFVTSLSYSQVLVNTDVTNSISGSNVFLDGSQFSTETGAAPYVGKGFIVPSVNLVSFEFDLTLADGSTFPTFFDGMVVYNNATGTTLTGVNRPSTATPVIPGFYYFSNPDGANNGDITGGRWIPIGESSVTVKSKTVPVTVAADPTSATLELGTSVISANEVFSFLGAKIYDNAGNLIMKADSHYDKATNTLTTGNGMMYQVLPAGDYVVVVDYK